MGAVNVGVTLSQTKNGWRGQIAIRWERYPEGHVILNREIDGDVEILWESPVFEDKGDARDSAERQYRRVVRTLFA